MDPSDSRVSPLWVIDSPSELRMPAHRSGLPRSLDLSFSTRPHQSPRRSPQVHLFVTSLKVAGFTISGRLANRTLCNEAESSSLALGLALSLSRTAARSPSAILKTDLHPAPCYQHTGGRSYMLNEQFTWLTPFNQRDKPELSWRTKDTKADSEVHLSRDVMR